MKHLWKIASLLAITVLAGCASQPQKPLSLTKGTISVDQKAGIVMYTVPDIKTTYPGAGCLLCLAAAAATNSGLSKHSQTLSTDDLASLKELVQSTITKQGIESIIDEDAIIPKQLKKLKRSKEPNKARYDFSAYKEKLGISHLAVIELNYAGYQRNYSSYIPTAAPQAVIRGKTYMVDLNTHTYVAYLPINIYMSADGEWKEENFPNLTNAYYQAVEKARDTVVKAYQLVEPTPAPIAAPEPAPES